MKLTTSIVGGKAPQDGMQRKWLPRSEKREPSDLLPRAPRLANIAAAVATLVMILSLLPLARARAASPTIVSLTFDDGRTTAYTARSILASHGMHATFFVNSPLLGSASFYMTWQQVNDLYSDGNEIGGHTAYHVNLPQIDPTEAQRQICDDRVNLLNHGYPATDFAYPYGNYNNSIESMVQACGYNSARTTDSGLESIPPANPYAIRMGSGSNSLSALESSVSNAEATGGWVPLTLHDICSGCSTVSISQADFTSLLDWLQGQSTNGVVVETVAQVVGGSVQPAVVGPAAPPPATGTNGLRNASLELDTDANSAPDCWQFDDNGQNSFTWTRTTAAHSGTYAEQVNVSNYSSGDNKLMVLPDLGACSPSVTPGHQYIISSWYNSSTPVYFTVFARDTQYAFSYWQSSQTFPASSGWAQASWLTPPIPSNVTGLNFGLTIGGNGSLTVDDLSIVDNVGATIDTTPPSVSLTAPSSGTTLSGQVQLSANASDNVALDHVDFLVDGTTVGSAVDASIAYSWNSRTVANGNHTFAARAVDTSGNTTTSPSVTAYVNNQSNNLLKNPSLEQATNGIPTCWVLGGSGTNTYTWTYTTDAHTGSHAENLSISAWTSGDRKLVNTQDAGTCAPAITPGHTYTVTAWYKSNIQPYIYVYYRNSSGSWVYWTQSAKLAVASGWTQASFTTPAVPAGATNISVGMGMSGVGSMTMDDFGLYSTS